MDSCIDGQGSIWESSVRQQDCIYRDVNNTVILTIVLYCIDINIVLPVVPVVSGNRIVFTGVLITLLY